jgi:Peptidase M15
VNGVIVTEPTPRVQAANQEKSISSLLAWTINAGLIGMIVGGAAWGALMPTPHPTHATKPPRIVVATTVDPLAGAPQDFRDWLAANPAELPRYQAFVAFLNAQGVADILPPWQVVQADTHIATGRCEIDPYVVPEEEKWAQIIPTLWLIKETIVPAVGPVRVLSGYRTPAANRCANGAEGSAHMSFSALDLQAINANATADQKQLFATLCRVWHQSPSSDQFGLGAYYVRNWTGMNEEGRFHVDTIGKRTWGHSYGAYTSHCRELGYIRVKSPEQIEAEEKAKLKAEEDAKLKVEEDAAAKQKAEEDARTKAKADAEAARSATIRAESEARTKAQTDQPTTQVNDEPKSDEPEPVDEKVSSPIGSE